MARIDKKKLMFLIEKKANKIFKKAKKPLKSILKSEIIDEHILKGKSPVGGYGRFDRYSESYRNAIRKKRYKKYFKRPTPVNLKLSGELIKSFKVSSDYAGKEYKIEFRDEKASYHQFGEGNNPIRRLLPGPDEVFTRRINRKIKEVFKTIISKMAK